MKYFIYCYILYIIKNKSLKTQPQNIQDEIEYFNILFQEFTMNVKLHKIYNTPRDPKSKTNHKEILNLAMIETEEYNKTHYKNMNIPDLDVEPEIGTRAFEATAKRATSIRAARNADAVSKAAHLFSLANTLQQKEQEEQAARNAETARHAQAAREKKAANDEQVAINEQAERNAQAARNEQAAREKKAANDAQVAINEQAERVLTINKLDQQIKHITKLIKDFLLQKETLIEKITDATTANRPNNARNLTTEKNELEKKLVKLNAKLEIFIISKGKLELESQAGKSQAGNSQSGNSQSGNSQSGESQAGGSVMRKSLRKKHKIISNYAVPKHVMYNKIHRTTKNKQKGKKNKKNTSKHK